MVLEALTNPFRAEARPWPVFLLGMLYATIAVFLSIWIFADYASLVMVFLTVLAAVPLFYATMQVEEQKDLVLETESAILKEHSKALTFFMFLFLGMVFAFTFWYIALPAGTSSTLFNVQSQTITGLNQHVTGNFVRASLFSKIFLNNVKVMVFCILFSFIYGMGSLFILAWNASVIGVAAGNFIRTHMASYVESLGLQKVAAYFYV
ncbi:stage II sporulation protein M, partial [Candidatus Woesearchaeota archaeon]|nr:stage II sporulation protein M [Candidatus Woesearchaeota archaeon]